MMTFKGPLLSFWKRLEDSQYAEVFSGLQMYLGCLPSAVLQWFSKQNRMGFLWYGNDLHNEIHDKKIWEGMTKAACQGSLKIPIENRQKHERNCSLGNLIPFYIPLTKAQHITQITWPRVLNFKSKESITGKGNQALHLYLPGSLSSQGFFSQPESCIR